MKVDFLPSPAAAGQGQPARHLHCVARGRGVPRAQPALPGHHQLDGHRLVSRLGSWRSVRGQRQSSGCATCPLPVACRSRPCGSHPHASQVPAVARGVAAERRQALPRRVRPRQRGDAHERGRVHAVRLRSRKQGAPPGGQSRGGGYRGRGKNARVSREHVVIGAPPKLSGYNNDPERNPRLAIVYLLYCSPVRRRPRCSSRWRGATTTRPPRRARDSNTQPAAATIKLCHPVDAGTGAPAQLTTPLSQTPPRADVP